MYYLISYKLDLVGYRWLQKKETVLILNLNSAWHHEISWVGVRVPLIYNSDETRSQSPRTALPAGKLTLSRTLPDQMALEKTVKTLIINVNPNGITPHFL